MLFRKNRSTVSALVPLFLLALSGCRIEGVTSVSETITLKDKKDKEVTLTAGEYRTAALFDEDKSRLDLKIKSDDGWKRIYLELPQGVRPPHHSGAIDVPAAQNGQNYDLRALASTQQTASQSYRDSVSCVLYERVVPRCRAVCDRHGRCWQECWNEREVVYGRQIVAYHYVYTVTAQEYQLLAPSTENMLAKFHASETHTDRVIEAVGNCY